MDLMLTLAAVAAITLLTGLGTLALPWTEEEITRTVDAARAVPAAAGELQRVSGTGLGEPVEGWVAAG